MPAYNASKFISEAIESALSQDYDKFELLIVDDASRDNTYDIIKEYKNHLRVRVYRNKNNQGVGATRNRIIRLARDEYISPCDADDIMLPGNLRRLSGYLDIHPDIGMVYADILVLEINEEGKPLKGPYVLGKDSNKTCGLFENVINHPGSMIRKSLILKVGGFDETVYSIDDWDLWLKLAEITKFKYLQGEIYYIWRMHPDSLTRTDKKWNSDVNKIRSNTIKRRYGFEFKI